MLADFLVVAGSAVGDPPHKDFENIVNTVIERSYFIYLSLELPCTSQRDDLSEYTVPQYDMQRQDIPAFGRLCNMPEASAYTWSGTP